MEFAPSGRLYLRWPADSDADGWRSWTSSLVSASRSMSPRGSRARTFSGGSSDLFVCKGVPDHIRSDSRESSRPSVSVHGWGVKTLFIEPLLTIGRMAPSRASFVLLRDELLEREAFDTLLEAKVLFVRWRQHTNTIRPHSALGYRPKAPPGVAAPCVPMACARANARGWSIGGQNPNLRTGVIHGGRSGRSPRGSRVARQPGERCGIAID